MDGWHFPFAVKTPSPKSTSSHDVFSPVNNYLSYREVRSPCVEAASGCGRAKPQQFTSILYIVITYMKKWEKLSETVFIRF